MNKGSFEHEKEILLMDGEAYKVVSIQDPKYNLYKVTRECDFGDGEIIKEGSEVIVTNYEPDEYGWISIRPLEGELSRKQWGVPPHMIQFIKEVTNLDSTGNPITVITLDVNDDG